MRSSSLKGSDTEYGIETPSVLEPSLGGGHHGEQLDRRGGNQTEVVDKQENDHKGQVVGSRQGSVRDLLVMHMNSAEDTSLYMAYATGCLQTCGCMQVFLKKLRASLCHHI
jgi:hypothetical protein